MKWVEEMYAIQHHTCVCICVCVYIYIDSIFLALMSSFTRSEINWGNVCSAASCMRVYVYIYIYIYSIFLCEKYFAVLNGSLLFWKWGSLIRIFAMQSITYDRKKYGSAASDYQIWMTNSLMDKVWKHQVSLLAKILVYVALKCY